MNWKKILGIALALVIIGLMIFKLKSNKSKTENKVYQINKNEAFNIEIDTVNIEIIQSENSFTGTFEPFKETKISAETQGKINRLLVDVGSVVSKGQQLIELDNSLLKLQLQASEVQIESLEADVARYTILANADAIQGVQLEKTINGLKAAKIQKATIIEQINKSNIKSPFNGIVTAKMSEEGAFAAPGVPLLQITNINSLKFIINVNESDLSRFTLNQNYTIFVDAFPEIKGNGKITMIGSKANMGSSFPIQFSVNNTSDLKIKSGMFGKVLIKGEMSEKGIVIPSSAIQGTVNKPQVYVVKNGKAVLHNITISKKIKNTSIVSNGLNEGDIIVKNGFINLYDGANVAVKN
jgi:membrane fusion protein, multidrug efflux system